MDKLITSNGQELNVTFVKPTTQKGKQLIRAYEYTQRGDSIYKAYGKPSSTKVKAFNDIVKEKDEVNGIGIKITGAGSDFFSCAYRVINNERIAYLIYHTHVNRFAVPLE